MKNILIVSYMFYPEKNPRAFRAYELANELSTKYNVDVLTKKDNKNDISDKKYNLIGIPAGILKNKQTKKASLNTRKKVSSFANILKNLFKPIFRYFISTKDIEFSYQIKKYLENRRKKYDVVISIALPFASHLGVWWYYKDKNEIPKIIMDYGDPFYKNPTMKLAFYFKKIEKKVIKISDYIVLPIEEAKKAFEIYKDLGIDSKIKIIPQGINIENKKIAKYKKNKIPTFMYAGVFYEKIRNPIDFFKELNKIDEDYLFYIYTNIQKLKEDKFGQKIIEIVNNSNGKIILRDMILREECIYEMSKMDFVINFENSISLQSASKVIDYSISNRPILSFNQENFKIDVLKEFFKGNYSKQLIVDKEKYSIKNVVSLFEELF